MKKKENTPGRESRRRYEERNKEKRKAKSEEREFRNDDSEGAV